MLRSLTPAAMRELEYIGSPIETSQSVMDVICPGDTGFRQISVRPPLGICRKEKKTTSSNQLVGNDKLRLQSFSGGRGGKYY